MDECRRYISDVINQINVLLGVFGVLEVPMIVKENITLSNEIKLIDALKYELQWLRDNNIIENLSDNDINEIIFKAKDGLFGWNKRLVYYDGT